MNYNKTLNLPETSFPIKADPSRVEAETLNLWKTTNIYEKRQRLNRGKPKYILHNPPQPAYDGVCIDSALSAILNDITLKYKLMKGFDVPYFPVWNCNTPDIDREVMQFLEKKDKIQQAELRKHRQNHCSRYINIQKEQLQKLGIFAYWNKGIHTSEPSYELAAIKAFGELYESGYLYKGVKPKPWCINCQSDLDQTEIEYKSYGLLSLYIKFPLIYGLEELGEDVYILVWTNTPWNLPANKSIAVHPDFEYAVIGTESDGTLIMADSVVNNIMTRCKIEEYKVIRKMKGAMLSGFLYANPLMKKDSTVILDNHISLDRGTGFVHHTPKYDHQEEYSSANQMHNLVSFVDQDGQLTEVAGRFYGQKVFDSSNPISRELEKRGYLLASESIEQSYPHCSYCKRPIIVRFDDYWLLDLNANHLRQRTLKVMEELDWSPDYVKNRVSDIIINRSNWSVSRRRAFGIQMPVFYCQKCDMQIDVLESIKASQNLIDGEGFTQWLTTKPDKILPEDVVCNSCGERDFRWEMDTLDPEFALSLSYRTAISNQKESAENEDVHLWINSQNEKWIPYSLLSFIATEGRSPFKSAIAHKSVAIENRSSDLRSIQEILDKYGADVLRFWTISMNYEKHPKISHSHIESALRVYKRVRNTCRFLLGNLTGFDPAGDRVEYKYLEEIDRWALHKLTIFIEKMTKAYESCQFHTIYRLMYDFCSVDMSSVYFSIVKRRIYTFPRWSSSRRGAQTVIYEVITALTRLMAPVLSFTAEEIWGYIPDVKEKFSSVYLSHLPDINEEFLDYDLESRWDQLLKIRSKIYKSLEKVYKKEGISHPSQASVVLYASSAVIHSLLDKYIDDLGWIFMVSKVRLMPPGASIPDNIMGTGNPDELAFEIRLTTGVKCERCWIYSDTVGTDEKYPTICHQCISILEGGSYYV